MKKKSMKQKAKEIGWAYMLERGDVVGDFQYYGGCFERHVKGTDVCLAYITEVGIDWSKTKEIQDDNFDSFNGTFDDTPLYVKFFVGTLVLNNGKEYKWAQAFEEPATVFEVVAMFVELGSVGAIVANRIKEESE